MSDFTIVKKVLTQRLASEENLIENSQGDSIEKSFSKFHHETHILMNSAVSPLFEILTQYKWNYKQSHIYMQEICVFLSY